MRQHPFRFALLVALAVPAGLAAQQKPAAKPKAWPPHTADGQPDIQGVWANPEQGVWTAWLEDTKYLVGLGLRGMGAERSFLPPGAPKGSRTTALIDPPSGAA